MINSSYNFDVAFSFVQKDEGLAYELYKLLCNRLSCFIYSEQQKRLAGADGEQIFNSVFSKESRIVIVLYRNEWGNTKWTAIEQTAIRNRGFEKGYDFVILVPTVDKFIPPEWLPKNRIWVGLERWGIESAASVIEARVQEFGGEVKLESVSDRVARAENNIKEKQKREQILASQEGMTLASSEVKNVITEDRNHEMEIKSKVAEWHLKVRDNKYNGVDIMSYGYYLTFQFYQKWANSPEDSYLFISLLRGYFDENGNSTDPFSENKQIDMTRVRFDINEFNQNGWTLIENREDFQSSKKLVELWFNKLLDLATEARMKNGQ